ncbi:hypothetical protein KHS38_07270 [Mucilaginibacter sp. Bleaf8]|nr:hypothetical protein [Mucilaginibacter sp. Bleaf8]MBS7564202.1 hypothetical protein [Mucilaginibacter sp. Bleaf8]
MRVDPSAKVMRGNAVDPVAAAKAQRIKFIVALIFLGACTYGLFIKILFL